MKRYIFTAERRQFVVYASTLDGALHTFRAFAIAEFGAEVVFSYERVEL